MVLSGGDMQRVEVTGDAINARNGDNMNKGGGLRITVLKLEK